MTPSLLPGQTRRRCVQGQEENSPLSAALAGPVLTDSSFSPAVARNQYERMGGDVTMQCGSLDEDASVSWKVNGTDVKAPHRLEGPRLILTQASLSHNGLYSCFQNPHGERRDTIYLHVGSEWLRSGRRLRGPRSCDCG